MTAIEALEEIQKEKKPYTEVGMSQSEYNRNVTAIKAGTIKPDTAEKFFNTFGYAKQPEAWELVK